MQIEFNKAFMDGSTRPETGHCFVLSDGDLSVPFVAHALSYGYVISHVPTGCCVESSPGTRENPVSLGEAIDDFCYMFDLSVLNLAKLEAAAASRPVMTPDFQQLLDDGRVERRVVRIQKKLA